MLGGIVFGEIRQAIEDRGECEERRLKAFFGKRDDYSCTINVYAGGFGLYADAGLCPILTFGFCYKTERVYMGSRLHGPYEHADIGLLESMLDRARDQIRSYRRLRLAA